MSLKKCSFVSVVRKVYVLFLILGLVSCSKKGEDSSSMRANTKVNLQKSMSEGEKSGLFVFEDWTDSDWWKQFEDETLSELIRTALIENPGLNHVRMKVKQANQEAYIVRSKLFPSISAGFTSIWAEPAKNGFLSIIPGISHKELHLYNLALDFSYVFDFWKKNSRLYEAALGVANSKQMQEIQSKLILSVAVGKEYFNLRAQMLKREYMSEIIYNLEGQLDLINLRLKNRIDNLIDINSIRMRLDKAKEMLYSLDGEIELEKHILNILLGKSPDSPLKLPAVWSWQKTQFTLPPCIGTKLLERRPDLLASLWMVKKNALMIDVATADFFPKIQLDASGGLQNLNFQDLFKDQSLMVGLIPSISQFILDGGKRRGNLRAKVAEFQSSVYAFNESLLKASGEVVDGMTKYQTIVDRLTTQAERVDSARSTLDLVTLRYRHGIDSYLAKLSVEEKYIFEKLTEVEMEREQSSLYLGLIAALGGGFKASEKETPKGVTMNSTVKSEG